MNEGASVTLNGSGSDPDGTIVSYAWTQTAGLPTVTLTGANSATAGFTAPNVTADTVFTFQLTVTDNDGATATDSVDITVTNVNQPPIANAGLDQTVNEGASVTLNGSGSDPDGTIASYAWTQTAGPTVVLSAPNNASTSFTAPPATPSWDTLTFQLTVTDNEGATDSETVDVSRNLPPTANNACISTPDDYDNTGNAAFVGTMPATDPEGGTLTYSIPVRSSNVNLKGNVIPTDATSGNFSYTPDAAGILGMDKFTYTVTDDQGLQATAYVWVFIGGDNNDPLPALRIMPLGDSLTEGTTVPQPPPLERVGYRRKLYDDLVTLANGKYAVDFVGGIQNGGSFTDPHHQGTPGQQDDQLAANVESYLNANQADILLLHIGTNAFDTSAADVATALDNIGTWEGSNFPVTVFLAQIIDDVPNFEDELTVSTFNSNLVTMLGSRPGDRVVLVDMQNGAALDYGDGSPGPDMADNLHPNQTGYDKMAAKWLNDMTTATVGAKFQGLPQCPP